MKEKIQRLMTGHYRTDGVNCFLMGVAMVLIALDLFLRFHVLYLLGAPCPIQCYYRMLSKNISKWSQENQKYLNLKFRVKEGQKDPKFKIPQARQFHIYKHFDCGQRARVPKGEGKISIHCSKCQTDFIKRS